MQPWTGPDKSRASRSLLNCTAPSQTMAVLTAVVLLASATSSLAATVGQAATFIVSAIGTAPLVYQWRTNGLNIVQATNIAYNIPSATTNANNLAFSVVVSNILGSVTSAPPATLTVKNILCIQSIASESGGQGMAFLADPGTVYDLFWRTNLTTGNWLFYTNLIGSGGNVHVCFTNLALPQAFFQLRTE